jgi:regulatory protein
MSNLPEDNIILERVKNLCARQEKCIKEIREYLKKLKVEEKIVAEIVKVLVKEGFIDEFRYSIAFFRDKAKFNKWGPVKIRMALKGKNIPDEIIARVLNDPGDIDFESIIDTEIRKKDKTLKYKSSMDRKAKLYRFAASRGFSSDAYSRVIKNIIESEDE